MAIGLGKFQVVESQSWNGFTSKNHIASIYNTAPQKASNIITRLLATNYVPTLDTMLSKFPVKYFDDDSEFTWDLIGAMERNYALVEARYNGATVVAGDTGIGAGGGTFELVFAEKAFSDVNMIVGEKNEIYPIRILEDPVAEFGQYVYKCELMGAVLNGMPGAELVSGKRFSKDFSPVEDTMSIKGGDIGFNTPISMRNEFSSFRMQHTAPGNMKNNPMKMPFEYLDPKTNKVAMTSTWMQHVEWKFEYEYNREKSRILMFATSNRDQNGDYHNVGKSGFALKMGSGIREQMEVSNTIHYNDFSIKLITNALSSLSEGKLSMEDRHFVLRTGERGAVQFSEAAKTDISGWLPLGFDNTGTNAIYKTSSNLHQNAYGAGFQFVEWLAPNGVKVTLEVDSFYDDPVRNKILHPKGGVAESYRYDIMYIGKIEGEPNIQKAMVNNGETRGWEYGLRNPFPGAQELSIMSNAVDGSTYHRACFGIGAIVRDPSRTMSLIPSILAA